MMLSSFSWQAVLGLISTTQACVIPSGLGVGPGLVNPNNVSITFDLYVQIFSASDVVQDQFEPQIEFRTNNWALMGVMNALAPYDSVSLDSFARVNVSNERRRCLSGLNSTQIQQYFDITAFYAFYFGIQNYFYQDVVIQNYRSILIQAGLNPDICNVTGFDCTDISTPWGLAYITAQEIGEFAAYDGWNAKGNYNRQYNQVPYEDWRSRRNKYFPRNDPWTLQSRIRWQPLQETDLLGFLFNQEHVVPHIGFTGRLMYLSPEYYCNLTVKNPRYNYRVESEKLLEKLRNLNDTLKAEVELFENKGFSLGDIFGTYIFLTGQFLTYDYWLLYSAFFDVLYESTMIVWRQKVIWDRVRPTSIIRYLYRDENITTYAGTTLNGASLGTQTYSGKDFQPYVRTMPHSEYPSGSACNCEAFAEFSRTYFGFDDFLTEPTLGFPLSLTVNAFSSTREPLTTPSTNITFYFSSWSDLSERCGQSRLNGGMHFEASVPAGANLCKDVGKKIAEAYLDIRNGVVPNYVADINNKELSEDICQNIGA